MWKIFYWLSVLLVVFGAACGVLALVLVFASGNGQSFEMSQLILPLICFLFAVVGVFIMKSYKKRINGLEKGE